MFLGFDSHQSSVQASQEYESTPIEEQVAAIGGLIQAGKVRVWGLSNESSYGVMRFCAAADAQGVPRPCTVQNSFSLLHRCTCGVRMRAWAPAVPACLATASCLSCFDHDVLNICSQGQLSCIPVRVGTDSEWVACRSVETELVETCSPRHMNLGILPWSAMAGASPSHCDDSSTGRVPRPATPGSTQNIHCCQT